MGDTSHRLSHTAITVVCQDARLRRKEDELLSRRDRLGLLSFMMLRNLRSAVVPLLLFLCSRHQWSSAILSESALPVEQAPQPL